VIDARALARDAAALVQVDDLVSLARAIVRVATEFAP
jgi:hypothetical protein